MKIVIADDERLARQRLRALIDEIGIGEIVAEASNGKEALSVVHALQPDVLLLDIRMPGIDGMQVAKALDSMDHKPVIIFATAFGEHALEAFDFQPADYVLKPVRKDRLVKALKHAQDLLNSGEVAITEEAPQPKSRSHISATIRGDLRLIPVHDIYYFMADEKYVMLYWKEGEVLINETLKELEREFSGEFLRIHRSTLVSLVRISGLNKDNQGRNYVTLKEVERPLEVSRRHLPTVRKMLKDMRISTY